MVEVVSKRGPELPQTASLFCEILEFVATKSPEKQIPQGIILGTLQLDPTAQRVFRHLFKEGAETSLQAAYATRTDPEIAEQVLDKLHDLGILNKSVAPSDIPNFSWDAYYYANRNGLRIGYQLQKDEPFDFSKLPFIGSLFRLR